MKRLSATTASATAALAPGALGAGSAAGSGVEVLHEEFGDVGALDGWVQVNHSAPPGSGWFQGNPDLFAAQSGDAGAYAAANFLGAAGGSGNVDNWLITPVLNLSGNSVLSFFTRGDDTPGFNDVLEVRFSPGQGTDTAGFTVLLGTVGGDAGYPADWTGFSIVLTTDGPGRFAFRYLGPAESLNYIGLDMVSVMTAAAAPSFRLGRLND